MKYAIGCDHSAVAMKETIADYLKFFGVEIWDCGVNNNEPIDYPDISLKVSEVVKNGDCDFGIVICGTGIGVSIVANKIPGIRCALCNDSLSARYAREHNNANILAMGSRIIGIELAVHIVDAFMKTPFSENERHVRRINKIQKIDEKYRDHVNN